MIASPSTPRPAQEPLSHHALLRWAEPFVRAGWRIDLRASDRAARRIAMTPTTPAAGTAERLELRVLDGASARLQRRSLRPDGLEASLTLDGAGPARLLRALQHLEAVPLWHHGDGFLVARRWHAACNGQASCTPRLVGATAVVGPFSVRWSEPGRNERSERVWLDGPARDLAALPADLFAVLGREWSLLHEAGSDRSRRASVRRRAGEAARTIEAAAAQLVRVRSEGPQAFHDRVRWRRLRVVAQRALPWLAADLFVVEAGLALPLQPVLDAPTIAAMAAAPLLLIAAWLRWTEDPRLELPPWPHPATQAQRW